MAQVPEASSLGVLTDDEIAMIQMMRKLRPTSAFHLRQGIGALSLDGIDGTLVLSLGRKSADPVEVTWVGGSATLQLRL